MQLARVGLIAVWPQAFDPGLLHGTLKELPGLEARTELSGPVMVIIGDAVAGADFSRSEPLGALAPAEPQLARI